MSVLSLPGVQKVWVDGELIFDRDQGGDLSALGFREYETGAEDIGVEGA